MRDRLATVVAQLLPSGVKRALRRLRRAYVQQWCAFTSADLRDAVSRLGVAPGDLLMMHSSYDRFLGFQGSPLAAIQALQAVLGPSGTLMMPTLPFVGSAIAYAQEHPVFDVRRTASKMGLVTEVFRRSAGVLRSAHPTHSVAVWGSRAADIVADHHVARTPCGRDTPYGRLHEYGGKLLFAGVPISTMTFFHFVEEVLEPRMPFPVLDPVEYGLRWMDEHGTVRIATMRLFSLRLAGHRDLTPLVHELRRRKQWREQRVGRLRLILLQGRDVYDALMRLAEIGVLCYDSYVLGPHRQSSTGASRAVRS